MYTALSNLREECSGAVISHCDQLRHSTTDGVGISAPFLFMSHIIVAIEHWPHATKDAHGTTTNGQGHHTESSHAPNHPGRLVCQAQRY